MNGFSFSRWFGIIIKEFIQLKRDRLTFGMIIGVPVIRLLLFGFAINTDPKNLPAAVLSSDNSVYARSLVRAMQMTFFFFLPSILLSGFMFPYRGMPEWAQWVSSVLPLTHFLVLVRGIMLKGNDLVELWPQIWPIVAFMLAVILIGLRFYKRTLD